MHNKELKVFGQWLGTKQLILHCSYNLLYNNHRMTINNKENISNDCNVHYFTAAVALRL